MNPRAQSIPLELAQGIQRTLLAREAAEHVRSQQQGHGRPIISFEEWHGYRIVAVGGQVFWSKDWLVFPDFLFHYLKSTLGFEWGRRESQKATPDHPLIRWLAKCGEYQKAHAVPGTRFITGPPAGYIACVQHLAYALYLIEHHDQLPKKLLRRLREPATFLPAYYETLVGAALAVAGFEIRCEETKAGSDPTPEFTATSKASRKRYSVEAKRKDGWKSRTKDPNDDAFRDELVKYVRGQLHKASKKRLSNAIFFIELSLPTITDKPTGAAILEIVKQTIREAQSELTIDGKPAGPAYVVVTSHGYLADEDIAGEPLFAFATSFNIPDYIPEGPVDMEELLASYDRHRDVKWLVDCLKIAATIPITFDGSPPELLDDQANPIRPPKIGDRISFPTPDGVERPAIIEEITATGGQDVAVIAVKDEETGNRYIGTLPLTEQERRAADRFGDAIFGKPGSSSNKLEPDDPLGLYDWILYAYRGMTREAALERLAQHPLFAQYRALSEADLRVRVAREDTKAIWRQTRRREVSDNAGPERESPT